MTLSILVADDSLASRLAIEEALEGQGYDLRVAVDGNEAEKALLADPDLVIADICMPGRTGYEIATLAKSGRSDLPVILAVGTFEPFDSSAFESSGADWCMKKPFDPAALRAKVDELLADSKGSGETDDLVVEGDRLEERTPDEPIFPEPPAESSVSAPVAGVARSEAEPVEASAEARHGLSDEDIDRIARRVVEIAGDGVLREIAWEVVPDLAEVIVRERLEKLERELEESS